MTSCLTFPHGLALADEGSILYVSFFSLCLRTCHNFTLKYDTVSFKEADPRLHYFGITWFVVYANTLTIRGRRSLGRTCPLPSPGLVIFSMLLRPFGF